MVLIRKILPFVTPIVSAILLELLIAYPLYLYVWLGLLVLAVFGSVWLIIKGEVHRMPFYYLALFPLFFILSVVFFMLFVQNPVFRHLCVAGGALMLGIAMHNIYTFIREPFKYQPYALENIAGYINTLTLFFSIAGLAYTKLLLNVRMVVLMPLILALIFFISLQTFWAQKVNAPRLLVYAGIFSLGIMEVSLASLFLPVAPFVQSLIITAVYYFFMNITSDYLLSRLERESVQRYAILSVIVLLAVFFTTRWK